MPEPSDENSVHEKTSAAQIVNEVHRTGNQNPSWLAERQMEMMRKLIVALERFEASSERWATSSGEWAKRLFWATWVLLAATLAIVTLTLVLVLKP